MTYDTSGNAASGNDATGSGVDDSEMPAPPPWLQFANPAPQDPVAHDRDAAQPGPGYGHAVAPEMTAPAGPDTAAVTPADAPPAGVQSEGPREMQSFAPQPAPHFDPQYPPGPPPQAPGQPYPGDPVPQGFAPAAPPAPDAYGVPVDPSTAPPPQYAQQQPAHPWPGPAQGDPQNHYLPGAPQSGAPNPTAGPPQGPPPMGAPYGGYPTGPAGFGDQHAGPALDEVALIRKARRAPGRGWRRAVHTLSGGTINPGESQSDVEYQHLLERVNRPVRGDYRIAVLSLKGGVGKTTTTVGLGSTFSSLRGDRVIAVDANPDLGTLAQRIPQQTRSTVRDLLADRNVYRYSDVRAHTSQAPSRLEVLASERDPAVAEAFSEEEYRGVIQILQRFYNVIITDCGTGLSHSAMNGVLDLANAIILVSSPALDGARSAGATLDWLEAHGYGHLVSRAVVVLSSSRPGSSTIDTAQLGQHFLTRCRAVHQVPFDDHLSEGAEIDLELVSKQTRRSFVELAATIADDFATPVDHPDPYYQ